MYVTTIFLSILENNLGMFFFLDMPAKNLFSYEATTTMGIRGTKLDNMKLQALYK